MKFGVLVSIGHNIASSISDGASLLYGAFAIDVYAAAMRSPNGRVVINFLSGTVIEGNVSPQLRAIFSESPMVLSTLASRHRAQVDDFRLLTASFGVDEVYGPHFTVVLEDSLGRRSDERYQGGAGRRIRRGHRLGGNA